MSDMLPYSSTVKGSLHSGAPNLQGFGAQEYAQIDAFLSKHGCGSLSNAHYLQLQIAALLFGTEG